MSFKFFHLIYICMVVTMSINMYAQPSLVSSQMILDQKIYKDVKLPGLFYYVPADYKILMDADGRPAFTLTEIRYTGTRAAGDAGVAKFNNLLQFHVIADASFQKKIADVKTILRQTNPSAELRPLPIRKFSSLLVFAGTGDSSATSDSIHMIQTNFSEATDVDATTNNSYWTERIINLRLNNYDAQIVESALKNHQSVLSFSYAMYSVFSEKSLENVSVYGNAKMAKQVLDFFSNEIHNEKDSALKILMVKANAFGIDADPDKWPSVIQKVDINEKVPARYPLFDVYCYDFNNELRADLFEKKIEIKARSVNGSDVITTYSFKVNRPDIYAQSMHFLYAVRFDKPFYYRVTEISNDGDVTMTDWKEKNNWSEILDITSPPGKVVKKQIETNQ